MTSVPPISLLAALIEDCESLNDYYDEFIVRRLEEIQFASRHRERFLDLLNGLVQETHNAHFQDIRFQFAGSYLKGTQVAMVNEYDILVECSYRYQGWHPTSSTRPTELFHPVTGERLSSTVLQNELKRLLFQLQDRGYCFINDITRRGASVKMKLQTDSVRSIDFDFIIAIPCVDVPGVWWLPNRGTSTQGMAIMKSKSIE